MGIVNNIKNRIQLASFRKKWRKENSHNATSPDNIFDMSRVNVGNHTYGALRVLDWGNSSRLLIGSFCSIAPEVAFLLDSEHHIKDLSTFPFKANFLGEKEAFAKGDIVVEDDVWIGYRATIMSGVRIGRGAIIAAGAVVTKDVPQYAIVGGNPAKVIKYRVDDKKIEEYSKFDFSKLTDEYIRNNIEEFYCD